MNCVTASSGGIMAKTANKLHAIVFALPYQGHINPAVNLAVRLASNGLTVTFVHTKYIHYTLARAHYTDKNLDEVDDLFSEARNSGLDIRYRTISDGFPLDFDRTLHFDTFWDFFSEEFPHKVLDEFVGEMIGSSPCNLIPFLVVDTFYPWVKPIALKYNLVHVSFWTQPATVLCIGYGWNMLVANGHVPTKDKVEEEITYLPGVKAISSKHLMTYFNEPEGTTLYKATTRGLEQAKNADFILANTVDELESEALSALNQEQPIYSIGPVCYSMHNLAKSPIAKSLWSESDCSTWLETKPPASVLYISFGSLAKISEKELQELAYGLLLSEVNFIWVVRADIVESGEAGGLPDEFKQEMGDKGLVIPWCNQTQVLCNPAVGGFLTHCGWNSVSEGLLSGVPMLCRPWQFDQTTNGKLVVEDWKTGMELFDDGGSLCRERVAEKINNLMSGDSSWRLRREAEKVKTIVKKALEINGSSERKLEQFIKDLKTKICCMNPGLSFR